MRTIGVQFTGRPTVYSYFVADSMDGELFRPGMRVVLPNKLKEDGTLSLTIATVVEVHDKIDPKATLPVVFAIPQEWIDWAAGLIKDLELPA